MQNTGNRGTGDRSRSGTSATEAVEDQSNDIGANALRQFSQQASESFQKSGNPYPSNQQQQLYQQLSAGALLHRQRASLGFANEFGLGAVPPTTANHAVQQQANNLLNQSRVSFSGASSGAELLHRRRTSLDQMLMYQQFPLVARRESLGLLSVGDNTEANYEDMMNNVAMNQAPASQGSSFALQGGSALHSAVSRPSMGGASQANTQGSVNMANSGVGSSSAGTPSTNNLVPASSTLGYGAAITASRNSTSFPPQPQSGGVLEERRASYQMVQNLLEQRRHSAMFVLSNMGLNQGGGAYPNSQGAHRPEGAARHNSTATNGAQSKTNGSDAERFGSMTSSGAHNPGNAGVAGSGAHATNPAITAQILQYMNPYSAYGYQHAQGLSNLQQGSHNPNLPGYLNNKRKSEQHDHDEALNSLRMFQHQPYLGHGNSLANGLGSPDASPAENPNKKQKVSDSRNTASTKRTDKRRDRKKSNGTKPQRTKALSSLFRGVSRCSKDGRWQARIRIGATVKYLGRFKTQEEAAKRYDVAAVKYHRERAVLNFNPDGTVANNYPYAARTADTVKPTQVAEKKTNTATEAEVPPDSSTEDTAVAQK